ncbi:MAG: hypothetical protein AMJ90_07565 [candidate division Zixibacteria bacterium SM23_73_2]|nr:MAG: hypothetical protein AMJ90_07565 [candidate division Zixibacteria bacterium SM23_73_2]
MKKIVVVAGETSGDLHAAGLLKELEKLNQGIQFFGMGGDRMKQAGVELYFHIRDLSFMGFWEVLKKIGFFRFVLKKMTHLLDKKKPDLAILVDYPGFNLKFAKRIKKRGIPILYYISPQIWAWGGKRIEKIKKLVDKMLVVFPFEKKIYEDAGVDVELIGHPLLDIVKSKTKTEEFRGKLGIRKNELLLGLFPGSRKQEVSKILPIMLEAGERLAEKIRSARSGGLKSIKLGISLAPTIKKDYLEGYLASTKLDYQIIEDINYDLMEHSDFLLVKSGTSTLEAAILGTPFVLIYKTGFLSWLVARGLVKIPYICLANIVAGKRIVEEFIQYRAKPELVAKAVYELLTDRDRYEKTKERLLTVKDNLGEKGAYHRGAKIVAELLNVSGV